MQSHPTLLIVAGEASADTHGAHVLAAVRQRCPSVTAFGVGGEALRAEGLEALFRAEDMSLAGLTEVLWALPRMWRTMRALVRVADERRPQAAVLIDLPDFNLRLARRLKALGIPVIYYISPQVWAWRQRRVQHIRAVVDQMLVILPFEETFYRQHNVPVRFVGHPLVEQLPVVSDPVAARRRLGMEGHGPWVALLPGSRNKEVARHLPVMLQGLRRLRSAVPEVQAVLPVASTISKPWVEQLVRASDVPVTVLAGQATDALSAADVAVVCSGTATLQAALLGRPMVVVYRVSWLTYQLLKRLIKVAHIALVNLVAGKSLVRELVQNDLTAANVATEVRRLLDDPSLQSELRQQFAGLRHQLGSNNTAGEVAEVVCTYLTTPPHKKDFAHV